MGFVTQAQLKKGLQAAKANAASAASNVSTSLGTIGNLNTTNKTNLVSAVNEVLEKANNATVEVDSTLSSTSEKPLQNKAIYSALESKANTSVIGNLSNLITSAKTDLVSAINAAASMGVTVDSALSSTSENPVQNKVIQNALNNIDFDITADEIQEIWDSI